ncbi:saccharopine dehydrogenase C-terminal domain-containing protein [soil metagenome]
MDTQPLLIIGAGKIGPVIACLLADTQEYKIHLADLHFKGTTIAYLQANRPEITLLTLDVSDTAALKDYVQRHAITTLISALPFNLSIPIVNQAKNLGLNYFDLTEDVAVSQVVKQLAQGASSAFVPQCGLAPGMVGIIANDFTKHFDKVDTIKLRVGALPAYSSNSLGYALNWSVDGLINEYINSCLAIVDGQKTTLTALEGLEQLEIDGCLYEAFNTSGGLGSLADIYEGKVNTLNYKTLRYPGHCAIMRLLLNDLKLNQDRDTLKRILENSLPRNYHDVVVLCVSVAGWCAGEYLETNKVKKLYPKLIAGHQWSAIQVSTASGACAIIDLVLQNKNHYHGLVLQEQFALDDVLQNRFGGYYS